MDDYLAPGIQCPFYKKCKSEKGTHLLYCEGIFPDTTTAIIFDKRDAMKSHVKTHCGEDFRSCVYAKVLYKKYDEEAVSD